jgi:hypothetical protein
VFSATHHDPSGWPVLRIACATQRKIHPTKSFIAPLNPRRPTVGAPSHSTRANSNSRSDNSAEQRDPQSVRRPISSHTRPETHQNLIHSNKEQHDRSTGAADQTAQSHTRDALPRHMIKPNSNIRDTDQSQPAAQPLPPRWPTALIVCEQTIAAVRGLGGFTRLLCKRGVVETIGIEPMTPCLQSRCSPS